MESPGQNIGVSSLSLLQEIFPTQGLNPGLPHCGWIFYQLSHKGSPRILKWTAYLFSRGSSWPRNQNGVSCILYHLSHQGSLTWSRLSIKIVNKNKLVTWRDVTSGYHSLMLLLFNTAPHSERRRMERVKCCAHLVQCLVIWTVPSLHLWRDQSHRSWCEGQLYIIRAACNLKTPNELQKMSYSVGRWPHTTF